MLLTHADIYLGPVRILFPAELLERMERRQTLQLYGGVLRAEQREMYFIFTELLNTSSTCSAQIQGIGGAAGKQAGP
jgi:hypothetical protein